MIRRRPTSESPRIVFAGRRCDLSAIPLQGLIQANIDIAACLIPARRLPRQTAEPVRLVPPSKLRRLPLFAVAPSTSIDEITSEQRIPLYEITDARSEPLAALLGQLQPDVLVVSCFPWRISAEILAIPRYAAINVHPSLLPRHRGPDPLFWTFRQGETKTGVSAHLMDDELDAGALVQQWELPLPAQIEGDKVERRLAGMIAEALPDIVKRSVAGTVEPVAQDTSLASYEGWPADEDLRLPRDWTIERVLRFVTGVVSLGYLPVIEMDSDVYEIESASAAIELAGGRPVDPTFVKVDFEDGPVWLRVASIEGDGI